jgi:hypothetical protein
MPFVEKHRYWGLCSEQGIESLHAIINKDLIRFSSIKNEELLFKQIVRAQIIRNFVFDLPNNLVYFEEE